MWGVYRVGIAGGLLCGGWRWVVGWLVLGLLRVMGYGSKTEEREKMREKN